MTAGVGCKFTVHFSTSFSTTRTSFRQNGTLLSCRRSHTRLRHFLDDFGECRFGRLMSSNPVAPWQTDLNGLCRIFGPRKILRMDFFQLHHPPDVTVLCDRKGCEEAKKRRTTRKWTITIKNTESALRTPTARRMLRGCRSRKQSPDLPFRSRPAA